MGNFYWCPAYFFLPSPKGGGEWNLDRIFYCWHVPISHVWFVKKFTMENQSSGQKSQKYHSKPQILAGMCWVWAMTSPYTKVVIGG